MCSEGIECLADRLLHMQPPPNRTLQRIQRCTTGPLIYLNTRTPSFPPPPQIANLLQHIRRPILLASISGVTPCLLVYGQRVGVGCERTLVRPLCGCEVVSIGMNLQWECWSSAGLLRLSALYFACT